MRRHNHAWFDDIRQRLRFEREAKEASMPVEFSFVGRPRRPRYRFPIDVPAYDERRQVDIVIKSVRTAAHPNVDIDGPICLRHRFSDRSLCMWLHSDPPEKKWVAEDGLYKLAAHVREHAWCEATCRQGKAWPKDEAPGRHPRKRSCPTCRGEGE